MRNRIRGTLWRRIRPDGEAELRTRSKFLLTIAPLLLAAALFPLLLTIEQLDGGAEVIKLLAYALILLVVTASLLTLVVSLIDYLRSME